MQWPEIEKELGTLSSDEIPSTMILEAWTIPVRIVPYETLDERTRGDLDGKKSYQDEKILYAEIGFHDSRRYVKFSPLGKSSAAEDWAARTCLGIFVGRLKRVQKDDWHRPFIIVVQLVGKNWERIGDLRVSSSDLKTPYQRIERFNAGLGLARREIRLV
jgi:hypothetical protein